MNEAIYTVFRDKQGRVVAAFRHRCDAIDYEIQNPRHHYQRIEIPDLDPQLHALIQKFDQPK